MGSLQYGYPGRDVMLRNVADIWWPTIHWEMVTITRYREECSAAGKNVKVLQKQSEVGKMSDSSEPNEEIALDFAGPFQSAKRKTIFTSIFRQFFSLARRVIFYTNIQPKKLLNF